MEDTFKKLLIGFILFSLTLFLILSFVVDVSNEYGRTADEITEGALDLDPIEESLEAVKSSADTYKEDFADQNIFSIVAGVVVTGIFSIAKNMLDLVVLPFTFFGQILTNILHVPSIITSVILGILIMVMIFAIWRLIKVGD